MRSKIGKNKGSKAKPLGLLLLFVAVLAAGFLVPSTVLAAYTIEIPIGSAGGAMELPEYIVAAHKFATAAAGVLAVVVMMIGGFLWLSSAGNANQVGLGKGLVVGAVTGLVLTFMSYYLLYAVNPNLVDLSVTSPLPIKNTENGVCCKIENSYMTKPDALLCTQLGGTVMKDDEKCSQKALDDFTQAARDECTKIGCVLDSYDILTGKPICKKIVEDPVTGQWSKVICEL